MLFSLLQLLFSAKFFPPPKKPSKDHREYLLPSEVKAMIREARKVGRNRVRDSTIIPIRVHPHQLRHACGYYLASMGHDTRAIQDYLGHKNIHHTVRYTQMSPTRFESFFTD